VLWDAFVAHHPRGWFFHTSRWIDYCLAYHPGAEDLSFAITVDGVVRAVCPLVKEGDAFLMGGNPGAEPIGDAEHMDVIERVVDAAARHRGVTRWALRGHATPSHAEMVVPERMRETSWHTHVMDLRVGEPEAALFAALRKSYRQDIRKAEARGVEFQVAAAPWAVLAAHRLHARVAGRETRPQATWDLMAQWAYHGHLLVALAVDPEHPEDSLRGMAMAIRWGRHAYYASGATLDGGLSHGLVWHLARALRCDGATRTFELGWAARDGDTDKEKAIAFFKSGFGGETWRVPAAEVTWPAQSS
jgi:hypothetical protein